MANATKSVRIICCPIPHFAWSFIADTIHANAKPVYPTFPRVIFGKIPLPAMPARNVQGNSRAEREKTVDRCTARLLRSMKKERASRTGMTPKFRLSFAVAAMVSGMTLASCSGVGGSGGSDRGFQASYFSARSALEAGNYDSAVTRYDRMLTEAGPLESRLRLEMAHALLRSDRYAEASEQARQVASSHEDNRRAAALSVVGTAEHRLAQEAMSRNDFGPATVAHLQRAQAAFAELLKTAPDLDPLGSMAERKAMVDASLKRLGA
ncbi:tetratricopeptide repeat protein [Sulfitobacter sp. D35]|uniref:tetratricopeptide repeat protein n=1 Tax=Sulfitobacter sp. D35 TaxID=3083252 RepID=UPI00296ED779|nr:tetratricopeptide repeat protein [Sulfitobacter sp. D35]